MPFTTLPLALTAGAIAFQVSGATSASVASAAIAAGGAAAITYLWKYRVVGASVWLVASGQTGINAVLSGLSPGSNYETQREATSGVEVVVTASATFSTDAVTSSAGLTVDQSNMLVQMASVLGIYGGVKTTGSNVEVEILEMPGLARLRRTRTRVANVTTLVSEII